MAVIDECLAQRLPIRRREVVLSGTAQRDDSASAPLFDARAAARRDRLFTLLTNVKDSRAAAAEAESPPRLAS